MLDSFGGAKCVPLLRAAFTQLVAALGRSGKSPGREGAARLLHACDVPHLDETGRDDPLSSASFTVRGANRCQSRTTTTAS